MSWFHIFKSIIVMSRLSYLHSAPHTLPKWSSREQQQMLIGQCTTVQAYWRAVLTVTACYSADVHIYHCGTPCKIYFSVTLLDLGFKYTVTMSTSLHVMTSKSMKMLKSAWKSGMKLKFFCLFVLKYLTQKKDLRPSWVLSVSLIGSKSAKGAGVELMYSLWPRSWALCLNLCAIAERLPNGKTTLCSWHSWGIGKNFNVNLLDLNSCIPLASTENSFRGGFGGSSGVLKPHCMVTEQEGVGVVILKIGGEGSTPISLIKHWD